MKNKNNKNDFNVTLISFLKVIYTPEKIVHVRGGFQNGVLYFPAFKEVDFCCLLIPTGKKCVDR